MVFKKGEPSWIKGKHHKPESNEKNRLAHLGKPHPYSPWKKGLIPWNKGTKGVMVAWNKGKTGIYSEETKIKMGIKPKDWNRWTPEKRKEHSNIVSGKSNPFYGKKHSAETKMKIFTNTPREDTSIEKKLHQILDGLNIKYKKHYPLNHPTMGFHPVDIMLLDYEQKPALAIECDGCYWHGCPDHHPDSKYGKISQQRDKIINECMKELGIKLIRLWEHDIKHKTDVVEKTIKNVIYSNRRLI